MSITVFPGTDVHALLSQIDPASTVVPSGRPCRVVLTDSGPDGVPGATRERTLGLALGAVPPPDCPEHDELVPLPPPATFAQREAYGAIRHFLFERHHGRAPAWPRVNRGALWACGGDPTHAWFPLVSRLMGGPASHRVNHFAVSVFEAGPLIALKVTLIDGSVVRFHPHGERSRLQVDPVAACRPWVHPRLKSEFGAHIAWPGTHPLARTIFYRLENRPDPLLASVRLDVSVRGTGAQACLRSRIVIVEGEEGQDIGQWTFTEHTQHT